MATVTENEEMATKSDFPLILDLNLGLNQKMNISR